MEKRKYKLLSFILILSLIFPFFPSVNVSANGLSFLPDFPYSQDNYYNVNNGSFALWQIHNSNYLSYVQTFTPNNISYPNPIIIFNKTWLAANYTYYLDYTYIIDSWDITGLHSDGFAGTQNIRVPNPNSDFVSDNVVYATLLYTTDNIIWKNGTDFGVYAYTNFYPDGYADPTPTPTLEPALPSPSGDYYFGFTYHQNGSDYDCHSFIFNDSCARQQAYGDRAVAALTDGNLVYSFYSVWEHLTSDRYNCMAITEGSGIVFNSSTYSIGAATLFYDLDTSSYVSLSPFLQFNTAGTFNSFAFSPNTVSKFGYKFGSLPDVSELNTFVSSSGSTYVSDFHFGAKAVYSYFGDGGSTPIATPTPTAIPTAIPQPTTNPNPTVTPEPDIKIVQPSNHWWDGLVKPIQYIFVPSSDKMMRTYNIMSTKFGVQKPTEFKLDVDSLVRPNNIVWKFKHVSLDGSNNEVTNVTLVDFEMIDEWLESSAGRMIIRIIRACFGLLMFGYLMYIFRKHIATINYTDAETLKDVYRNSGGGEDD